MSSSWLKMVAGLLIEKNYRIAKHLNNQHLKWRRHMFYRSISPRLEPSNDNMYQHYHIALNYAAIQIFQNI